VTNLDFVELLLEAGADLNAHTVDVYHVECSRCGPTFLLSLPTTDVNVTTRSGASLLAVVRATITVLSDRVALPGKPEKV
jgi:hypothetical protein